MDGERGDVQSRFKIERFILIGFKRERCNPARRLPPLAPQPQRAEETPDFMFLYCNSLAKKANRVDSRGCEPREVQPRPRGQGTHRAAFFLHMD